MRSSSTTPCWIGSAARAATLPRRNIVTSPSPNLLDEATRLLPADEDECRIWNLDPDRTAQAIRDAVLKLDLVSAREATSDWESPIRLSLEFAAYVGFSVGEGHWNDDLILRMEGICDAVGVGEDAECLKSRISEVLPRVENAARRMGRYQPKSVYAERPDYFYDARGAACWLAAYLIGLRFAESASGS
jgi:hypothetical protein